MPRLSIEFVGVSPSPSVLVDGSLSGPLVREFVADELRSEACCASFLQIFGTLPQDAEYDHGFGNALSIYVKGGVAHFEHVIADIPEYKMPLAQLVEIVQAWEMALESKSQQFAPRSFEIPE